MPSITFDRFDGGLMLARPSSTAPANTLSKMVNFWPQPGGSLRNRPSWRQVPAVTLSAANAALESNGGALWVFSVGSNTPVGAYPDTGAVGGGGGGGGGSAGEGGGA